MHLRELSAEKQNDRRVINPQQDYHDRSRSAIRRSGGSAPKIKSKQKFSQSKQCRREQRTATDIIPFDRGVKKDFEDHRKQQGDHKKRHKQMQRVSNGR